MLRSCQEFVKSLQKNLPFYVLTINKYKNKDVLSTSLTWIL